MIKSLFSLFMMFQAEHACLAENVYYESRNQPIAGQIAVAEVTLNRVEHSRYPDTICEVVYQPWQFSWVREDKNPPKGEAWHVAQAVAYRAMLYRENTDILHFHATYVQPYWAEYKVKKMKIKDHIFYS